MSDESSEFADMFEAYLDNQLDAADRDALAERIAGDPDLAKQVELQEQIDAWAKRLYSPPTGLDVVPTELSEPTKVDLASSQTTSSFVSRRQLIAILVTVASVAWLVFGVNYFRTQRDRQIAFKPTPLTDVYGTCVKDGFEPYWVCEDDSVFATTFERRQGRPLQLSGLPDGREMVGLSYLAGISQKSTSMLAKVDGKPVIVFIDRIDRDWHPEIGFFEDKSLYVFRREDFGLVFYEVTPFDEVRVATFFTEAAAALEN